MASESGGKRRTTRSVRSARILGMLLLSGFAVGNVDCAVERAAIDRTQPNALPKSFFVGQRYRDATDDPEFYMNNFVVSSPASQSLVPVGTYDDVDRVRWEIQENMLLARKAYEQVTNSDGHGVRGRTENGIIVAAYRIQSHFDRRQAYNPSTGEAMNVWEENMSDRPWYARDFIRVDWSQNMVDNPDWRSLFYGSLFGSISFQPVRYNEQDPTSSEAPNFCEMQPNTVRGPDGRCVTSPTIRQNGGYFDVTSHWLVNPENNGQYGIPTCLIYNFFTGSDSYECNPQETTIRTSFRRVEDRDFEPLELTRQPYDMVGGPRATRNGYDRGYGPTDANFHRYAMIHNLWQQSHVSPAVTCENNNDGDHDGTADACASARKPGSQCDMVMGRCTMPYSEREVRPIVYYVNSDMPAEMQDHLETAPDANGNVTYSLPRGAAGERVVPGGSEQIIATWNISVLQAVANAREVECRRLGGDRQMCHDRFFEAGTVPQEDGAFLAARPKATRDRAGNVLQAVVMCHNPVRRGDSANCREEGYSVRFGDIRYNHLAYIDGNSRAPFGGIAHWGYDPLTGEIISNGATNMGRSVDAAAAQQRDYIRLIINSIDPSLDSLTVAEYVQGGPGAVLAERIRNPAANNGRLYNDQELAERIHSVDVTRAASRLNGVPQAADFSDALLWHDHNVLDQSISTASAPSPVSAGYDALAARLRGTRYETDMIDPQFLAASGVSPNQALDTATLNRVSPLRQMDPEAISNLRSGIMRQAELRGFCFTDMEAPAMIGSVDLQGVARWYLNKYRSLTPEARARRIFQDLRLEAYKGIAIHEVGHSMGLYHVPVSSYDSMNYNPQYWQLRTREGAASASCRPACNQRDPSCRNVRNGMNVDGTQGNRDQLNNDNCMGPRYLDPETDEELGTTNGPNPHAGINYFANTSVMEYQWERFDETVGLGSYDQYAMGILYGRVVETFETDPARGGVSVDEQRRFAPRMRTQLADQDQIFWYDPQLSTAPATPGARDRTPLFPIHYTELARQMNVFDPARCRDATPEERERYKWRIVDGKLCGNAPRDHASMVDLETSPVYPEESSTRNVNLRASNWRTIPETRSGGGNVRWAYRVAWDIGTGYPHINYFDQGADIYEVSQSIIRKYELSYPTMYFRRSNREWAWWGVPGAVSSRMFRLLRGYHWSVARDVTTYSRSFSDAQYAIVANDDNWLRPYLAIQPTLFDFFAGVLLRPEAGGFVASTERSNPELRTARQQIFDADDSPDGTEPFNVGMIDGRFVGSAYDNAAGGSWDYHAYITRVGAADEKPYAAIMLTDTRPTFSSITRNLFLDGREFQVNFATDMGPALDRLIGGVLSEDWATVAPSVPMAANGATVTPQPLPLYLATPTRAASNRVLFPNVGYRQQLAGVIYSMLFSSLSSDLDLVNRIRIFSEGGAEQVDIPDAERVRFVNPESGVTYVARRYGPDMGLTTLANGRTVDQGIGSRMLAHANALVIDAYRTSGVNPDGTPILVRDAGGNVQPREGLSRSAYNAAVGRFHDYSGVIDATRHVAAILGYGRL